MFRYLLEYGPDSIKSYAIGLLLSLPLIVLALSVHESAHAWVAYKLGDPTAYNQPVTRAFIDTVRGVDSAYAVGSLLDKELIAPVGRLDAPGRPMLYGTTEKFLRVFGLSSIKELPAADSVLAAVDALANRTDEDGEAAEETESDE